MATKALAVTFDKETMKKWLFSILLVAPALCALHTGYTVVYGLISSEALYYDTRLAAPNEVIAAYLTRTVTSAFVCALVTIPTVSAAWILWQRLVRKRPGGANLKKNLLLVLGSLVTALLVVVPFLAFRRYAHLGAVIGQMGASTFARTLALEVQPMIGLSGSMALMILFGLLVLSWCVALTVLDGDVYASQALSDRHMNPTAPPKDNE